MSEDLDELGARRRRYRPRGNRAADVQFCLKLNRDEAAMLSLLATQQETTRSDLLRALIRAAFDRGGGA